MKHWTTTVALTLLSLHLLFSQKPIKPESLVFHSDLERQAFASKSESKVNIENALALLLAVNPENTQEDVTAVQTKIRQVIGLIEAQEVAGKKYKKASKAIFATVHDRLLRQYDIYAQFDDLFENGRYNCATASALYAIILEHFRFPYALVEKPDHVNVLLDPGGENIVIESTDPTRGLYAMDKKKIVESLVSMKLVSQASAFGKTAEQVYAEYFKETERKIDFRQLAGDLYNNAAIKAFDNDRQREALDLIEKSLYLNPSKLRDHTRLFILARLADTATDEKPENFRPYFALLEYEQMRELLKTKIKYRYSLLAEKYLVENYSAEKYAAFQAYFFKNLAAEPELLQEVKFIHHATYGRSLMLQYKEKEAFNQLDSAYTLKPDNLELQGVMTQVVGVQILKLINQPEQLGQELDTLLSKYPFLKNNPKIKEIQCYQKGLIVSRFFEDNNADEGFKALPAFEQKVKDLTEKSGYAVEVIGSVYASIHSYYVRKDDLGKAEEWLKKGMEEAPGSIDLKNKRDALDHYYRTYGTPKPKSKNR